MRTDRFGNKIDSSVGYARGRLLGSSADEIRRLRRAQFMAANLVAERGAAGIGIFTGNPRQFPLLAEDLETYCEEWVGPGLFAQDLAKTAIAHLGGREDHAVAVFNRTSAAIVASVLALSDGQPVVSFIPQGDRSHASVVRGCALARVELIEIGEDEPSEEILARNTPALVIITTVTSSLSRLPDDKTRGAIAAAKRVGAAVLLDEAYGARLRPVLHGGAKSLQLGADMAVTNADKAGLSGPRAGIMVGECTNVLAVQAKASELGQEARAPIAAGAMRSLQRFDPEHLRTEARDGSTIAHALSARFGPEIVHPSDLGPAIGEEDILALVQARGRIETADVVPAEASAALGMILLRDLGVLTVNTHGAPGGRVSLRLKPTYGALAAVGGAEALAVGVDRAVGLLAENMHDLDWLSCLLFGEKAE